jgi:hypothetical protein
MGLKIAQQSKQYIKCTVEGKDASGPVDPTVDPIAFAFVEPEGAPVSGTTWTNGTWETFEIEGFPDVYKARCLVGPGGAIELPIGSYDVFIKITHGLETVILKSDSLLVE